MVNVSGFVENHFRLNSSAEFWAPFASGALSGVTIGISRENAIEQYAIHQEFPGKQDMSRAVQCTIVPTRYSVKKSKSSASGIAHSGVPMAAIDVHSLVYEKLQNLGAPEVVETAARVNLPDGSVVIGERIKIGSDSGPINNKQFEHEDLIITYDASRFAETGAFSYSVELNTTGLSADRPLGFCVETKILFDDTLIETQQEEFLPVFAVKNGRIGKFKHFKKLEPQRKMHLALPDFD